VAAWKLLDLLERAPDTLDFFGQVTPPSAFFAGWIGTVPEKRQHEIIAK